MVYKIVIRVYWGVPKDLQIKQCIPFDGDMTVQQTSGMTKLEIIVKNTLY